MNKYLLRAKSRHLADVRYGSKAAGQEYGEKADNWSSVQLDWIMSGTGVDGNERERLTEAFQRVAGSARIDITTSLFLLTGATAHTANLQRARPLRTAILPPPGHRLLDLGHAARDPCAHPLGADRRHQIHVLDPNPIILILHVQPGFDRHYRSGWNGLGVVCSIVNVQTDMVTKAVGELVNSPGTAKYVSRRLLQILIVNSSS